MKDDLGSYVQHDGRPGEFWPVYDAHAERGLPHGAWIPDKVLAARR